MVKTTVILGPTLELRIQALKKVPEHVRGCALLLDRVRPGWENEIDLQRLNFTSNRLCIVGQLWGHVHQSPYWQEIVDRYPLAVMSWATFTYWVAEIEARGGKFKPKLLTVPVEWTEQGTVVNGHHRVAAQALLSQDVD